MMGRYFTLARRLCPWVWAALLALMTACNSHDNDFNPEQGGSVKPNPDPEVTDLQLIVTRKGSMLNSSTWSEGNTLGLFLTRGSLAQPYRKEADSCSNIRARMLAGTWHLTPEHVGLTEDEAVIYAYGPYLRQADPYAIPVETESSTDYVYGTHLGTQTMVNMFDRTATLEMKHALSLLDIRVRKNHDFKQQAKLEGIIIESSNDSIKLPVSGTLDISNGRISPTGFGSYTLDKLSQVLSDEYVDSCAYRLTLMPRDNMQDEVQMTIIVNGNRLSLPLNQEHDWQQGVINTYNIVFSGDDLRVEKVEITQWSEVMIEGEFEGR